LQSTQGSRKNRKAEALPYVYNRRKQRWVEVLNPANNEPPDCAGGQNYSNRTALGFVPEPNLSNFQKGHLKKP